MTPTEEALNMLAELHTEVRQVLESHVPDNYAKEESLFCLDMAFDNAKEAISENSN